MREQSTAAVRRRAAHFRGLPDSSVNRRRCHNHSPAVKHATLTSTAEAWTLFWSQQGQESRCLARSPELCERLDSHWARFASRLNLSRRVIDLGCGSGAVGRALRSAAPLIVTGVDVARVPPVHEAGLEFLSNVPMESLPFPDAFFGAAVSQFGYEYADPEATSAEVARVLAPRAPFCFLIHHPDGPIVAAMRRHRRAIEGLCGLRVQEAFFSGNANTLAERIALLKRECADDAVVEQAEHGLHMQIRNDELSRLQVWKGVVEALAPELFMLDSLGLCCTEDRSIDDLIDPLTRWFEVRPKEALLSSRGEPIAWIVAGNRLF